MSRVAEPKSHSSEKRSWRTRADLYSRRGLAILIAVVALLVALRIAAPPLVLHWVNHKLDGLPDYRGHADDVSLGLWRGAYKIYGLKLEKRGEGGKLTPYIDIPLTDFSVEWKALIHGSFVGEVDLYNPKLNLIDSPRESEKQLTISKTWSEKFKELFPLTLNRFVVHDGELTFRNPRSNPPVFLKMTDLQVQGTNLTNAAHSGEKLSGKVDLTAHVLKSANLKGHIELDPIAKRPNFNLTVELTKVVLPELNNFLRAYASVDAEKGKFELFSEIHVKDGKITGYAKPIVEDLSLVKLEDLVDNPFRFIWESIVSVFTFLFTNHAHDTIATKIPLTGTVDGPDPDWFALITGLFVNAYIEHLKPQLDK